MQQLTLALPEGVLFNQRSLTIPPALSADQYLDLGRYLSKARGSLAFWIADWREHFRKAHGDEAVQTALMQIKFEGEDWRAVESLNVAHERLEGLSAEHHFVLAKATDDNARHMWGELAEKEKLTPRELQLSIRAGTITRITPSTTGGVNTGVASIEAVMSAFQRWRSQVGDQDQQWQQATIDEVLAAGGPMIEYFDALRVRKLAALPVKESAENSAPNLGASAAGEETSGYAGNGERFFKRAGKAATGAVLDGREWREMPNEALRGSAGRKETL